jgi:phage baseplate assembly protein W
MINDSSFLGRGWSFPPEFTKDTKKIRMVEAECDIEESLGILLTTTPGERIMQPDFGCNLKSLVFEDITLSTQTLAKEMIKNAVLFFESRVILNDVKFNTEEISEGHLYITLDYTIRSTNTRFNMVFPYYIKEGTGVEFK